MVGFLKCSCGILRDRRDFVRWRLCTIAVQQLLLFALVLFHFLVFCDSVDLIVAFVYKILQGKNHSPK